MAVAKVLKHLVLALLAVLIFGLYQRKPEMAVLPWYALVPWLLLYTDPKERPSWIWWIISVPLCWIALHPSAAAFGPSGWLGLTIISFWVFPSVPCIALIYRRLKVPRFIVVPIIWTTFEWVKASLTISHLDLYQLGYSQARFKILVQIADLLGSYGISFIVSMWSGLVADFYFAIKAHGFKPALKLKPLRIGFGVFLILFGSFVAYGLVKLKTIQLEQGPKLAIIQPNIRHTMNNAYGVHLSQWRQTLDSVEPNSVDLVVWPENAILDYIDRPGMYLEDLAELSDALNTPVLLGALAESPEVGKTRNSAFLFRDGRLEDQRYDKQVLHPLTEFVPFEWLFDPKMPGMHRFIRSAIRGGWGFVPTGSAGNESVAFDLLGHAFGVIICIENVHAPLVSDYRNLDVRFLINITSEGEAGGPVQEQLLRICIMRAIENRMGYVRVGNTGISGFINPHGSVHALLEGENGGTIGVAGSLEEHVQLAPQLASFYAFAQKAFVWSLAGLTLVLLVLAIFWNRRIQRVSSVLLLGLVLCSCGSPAPSNNIKNAAAAKAALEAAMSTQEIPDHWLELSKDACAEEENCEQSLTPIAFNFRAKKQFELGAAFFENVAERYPSIARDAFAFQALMHGEAREYQKAMQAFENAKVRDASPRYRTWFGSLLVEVRDYARAKRVFERIWREYPEDIESSFLYARALYLTADDPTLTRIVLDDILSREPDHARARTLLGRLEESAGDLEEAKRQWRIAAEADETHLEGRYLLARTALSEGDRETADQWIANIRSIEAKLGKAPVLEEGG